MIAAAAVSVCSDRMHDAARLTYVIQLPCCCAAPRNESQKLDGLFWCFRKRSGIYASAAIHHVPEPINGRA